MFKMKWKAVKHEESGYNIEDSVTNEEIVGDCGVNSEENAKLIASAPELAKCLSEALDYLSDYDFIPFSDLDKWYKILKKSGFKNAKI